MKCCKVLVASLNRLCVILSREDLYTACRFLERNRLKYRQLNVLRDFFLFQVCHICFTSPVIILLSLRVYDTRLYF